MPAARRPAPDRRRSRSRGWTRRAWSSDGRHWAGWRGRGWRRARRCSRRRAIRRSPAGRLGRDEGQVVEAKPNLAASLGKDEPAAAADVRAQLAATDIDPELRRRALEDD